MRILSYSSTSGAGFTSASFVAEADAFDSLPALSSNYTTNWACYSATGDYLAIQFAGTSEKYRIYGFENAVKAKVMSDGSNLPEGDIITGKLAEAPSMLAFGEVS